MAEHEASASEVKTGPSERLIFDVGYGKGELEASQAIITSSVELPNEKKVLVNGKLERCGYISHSALESYSRCAKQFELKYIKRLKPRLLPRLKMFGGNSTHSAVEFALKKKLAKQHVSASEVKDLVEKSLVDELTDYQKRFDEAKKAGDNPEEMDFGERISNTSQFTGLYKSVLDAFMTKEFPTVKPLAVEELFVHHFETDFGGTVPIVGFIDLVEELPTGELCVTDHKVGMAKKQRDVDTSQQLTMYSMAKTIPLVAINSFALGTTGGKSGRSPKPGEFLKLTARKTIKDYERTSDHISATLRGIKAGAFPRSGLTNPIVCAPDQCPFYEACLGKKGA